MKQSLYRLIDINCNYSIEWLACFNYVCFLKQLTFKLRFTCSLLSLCSQKCLICDLHFFFPPKCFTVSLLFSLIATNISGSVAWGRLSRTTKSRNSKKIQWAKLSCPCFLARSCKSCGCFNVCMCNGKEVRDQSRGEQQQGWEMSGKEGKGGSELAAGGQRGTGRASPRDLAGIGGGMQPVSVCCRAAKRGSGMRGNARFCSFPRNWLLAASKSLNF